MTQGKYATVRKEVKAAMTMTQAAVEARRAYKRRWNAQNRDRNREYMARYWEKKAAQNPQISAESRNNGQDAAAQRRER
jgi:hypothetical protein